MFEQNEIKPTQVIAMSYDSSHDIAIHRFLALHSLLKAYYNLYDADKVTVSVQCYIVLGRCDLLFVC